MSQAYLDPVEMDRLHKFCIAALQKYPPDTQFEHLKEEMGELLIALSRLWRKRSTDDDVLEELVDVFMCTVEMGVHHFGPARFNTMLARKNLKFETSLIEGQVVEVAE
jgi:hypothetical protein